MNEINKVFLLTPFIIVLFWTITLSVSAIRKKQIFKIPLILFFFDSLLAIFQSSIFYFGRFHLFQQLYIPSVFFSLSMFPLFYIYISRIIQNEKVETKFYIKHIAFPFLNATIAFVVLKLVMDDTQQTFWFHHTLIKKEGLEGIQKFAFYMDDYFRKLFLATSLFYYWLTDKKIRKQKAVLQGYFSNSESGEITWFPVFRISFFLTVISAFLYSTMQRYSTLQVLILPAISHVLLAVFFWISGYYGQRQNEITLHVPVVAPEKEDYVISELLFIEMHKKVEEIMRDKKLFLQPDLTLPDLARHIGTNRSYLSRLFNDYLNLSYSYYVNKKRIEVACSLINEQKENTDFGDLSVQCGFSSKASFYRWFKNIENISPQKYGQKVHLK